MKKLVLVIAFCFLLFAAQAQNAVNSVTADYEYVITDSADLALPDSIRPMMLKKDITASISTGNTSGVSVLAVLLGSSEGSNDLFYKEFALGVSGDFNDGTSYHSSGSGITIGMGIFPPRQAYYVEVVAIKEDGSRSESRRDVIND